MTKLQSEKLFDGWLDKAEQKGKDKQKYAEECIEKLIHEYKEWFGETEFITKMGLSNKSL